MAVNLLAILVISKAIFTVSLNLEPTEFLGSYPGDPTRWPYGGCTEVVKIYPAPGSHLLPPPDIYAEDWNLTITVVFSRPVTRILWDYDIRIWLWNVSLSNDSEVLSCAKQACLIFVHNGVHIYQKAVSAGPTKRGSVFSDEYQFTFKVPTYVKDHMSEAYFALDGGWMYSPVYKFITNADVEYVPYVAVRYLPPRGHLTSASSRPPERDTNYWVNYPSTCAARSGLVHRPSIFSRAKREQQLTTANKPKLLAELTEIVKEPSEGQRKLKLYYQMRQRGVHTVELPDSIKLVDKDTMQNVSFSPTIKSIIISFTSPYLYIPVEETSYVFDYRERAYYEPPKWNAYFFTLKREFSEVCHNNTSFDCNTFQYSRVFPRPSLHSHHITIQSLSDGYRRLNIENYGLKLQFYHQLMFPENKQFYKLTPLHLFERYEIYARFMKCLAVFRKTPQICYKEGWNFFIHDFSPRNLSVLVLDPYWKLISIRDNYNDEVLDHFLTSNEIPLTVYKSEGITVPQNAPGMMHLSAAGSLYEKNMDNIIPLLNFHNKFQYQNEYKMVKFGCQDNFKRNVGKWGVLRSYIEYGNMYQLHVSKAASNWTVQQTMKVEYKDRNDRKHALNAAIVSFPEHIRRVVEKYAVLTNVQPSVYTDAQRDARLRAPKESYPLEKAVFVPRELINKHGCGTLRITEQNVKQYSQQQGDLLCRKSPDDCTGLPLDSLDRFSLIPPFNVLDLTGSVDLVDVRKEHHRRALYYRDNTVNDLFILNSPNSYYTGVVEISGAEIKEPEFVKTSCDQLWEFSPDRNEITKGHLTATLANKGEGGSDVVLTVRCTPKLAVLPDKVTVWVAPRQTKSVRFVLAGYRYEGKEDNLITYKCNVSISINVAPFASVVGKTFPVCNLFIPTFGGYFVNPCNNSYSNHDIIYYHLPREFVHRFSLREFRYSKIGRDYQLLKLISIKLVKYHMIQLSCDNIDIWPITEDRLISSSWNIGDRDIDLVYSIDELLHEKVYIFIKRNIHQNIETRCLLTMISTPFTPCEVVARKYLVLTKADIPVAAALQKEEEERAVERLELEQRSWYKSISEREEVLSAIVVCIITSLILIALVVTGNSALHLYDKHCAPEKKIELVKLDIQLAKQKHEETWKNPMMYLKSGILGPHYVLQKFKATDALDTADLRMLKLSGVLRYKKKEVQVIVEYIDKITIKKPRDGKKPDEVWLKASTGMYLLKQNFVSEEYKEEFDSFLERYMKRYRRKN